MLRPEIMNRIRETNNIGLANWLKANIIEADNKWYNDHPDLKNEILEEASFIAEILNTRKLKSA
jgi:hypothetical protein